MASALMHSFAGASLRTAVPTGGKVSHYLLGYGMLHVAPLGGSSGMSRGSDCQDHCNPCFCSLPA